MDHIKVVRRAFDITWRYKLLWVFGVVLALTSGGGMGGGGGRNGPVTPGNVPGEAGSLPNLGSLPDLPVPAGALIGVAVVLVLLLALGLLVLSVLSEVAKYVSLTAVIKLTDDFETTGQKRTFGEGLRLGWSRAAWRLFLVHVVILLPVVVLTVAVVISAFAPLLLWLTGKTWLGVLGTVVMFGLLLGGILIMVILSIAAGLVMTFAERSCALDDMGVFAGIKHGWTVIRARLKDVGLMWLLMLGVGLAWALVSLVAFGALAVLGLVLGGIPALVVGLAVSMVAEGALPWLAGGLVGLPVCILVVFLPSLLLQAWYLVFQTNVWTLLYREVRTKVDMVDGGTPATGTAAFCGDSGQGA